MNYYFYKGIVARIPVPEGRSIFSSASHFVQWSESICVILVEGIIGNIHVKLFKFGHVVQQMSFKEKIYEC